MRVAWSIVSESQTKRYQRQEGSNERIRSQLPQHPNGTNEKNEKNELSAVLLELPRIPFLLFSNVTTQASRIT